MLDDVQRGRMSLRPCGLIHPRRHVRILAQRRQGRIFGGPSPALRGILTSENPMIQKVYDSDLERVRCAHEKVIAATSFSKRKRPKLSVYIYISDI
ncbi:hypothetical protein TWF718_005388 [Orbilia javanica]|uniref:Uncharacterized protein n=1 Tax=Orbilia javanica TaxID=47235 RepID=A0AAN8MUJ5_9PEZI